MKFSVALFTLVLVLALITLLARPVLQQRVWGEDVVDSSLFHGFDQDSDGIISYQEIFHFPRPLEFVEEEKFRLTEDDEKAGYPDARVDPIFRIIDTDGDSIFSDSEVALARERLWSLDKNQDGDLDITEIVQGVGWDNYMAAQQRPNKFVSWLIDYSSERHMRKDWKAVQDALKQLYFEKPKPALQPPSAVPDGYLLYRLSNKSDGLQIAEQTRLIDPAGELEEAWDNWRFTSLPGVATQLSDDGRLLQAYSRRNWLDFELNAGLPSGSWELMNVINPDGARYWQFEYCQANEYCLHDEVALMPGGNMLVLVYVLRDVPSHVDPDTDADQYWSEQILELQPNYTNGATKIVWQWDLSDHLRDPNGPDIQPGKLDLEYALAQPGARTSNAALGLSSIDYDPRRDQILLNSPITGEVYVLDHGIDTQQAQGSAGDFLWRWGNPEAYGAGAPSDRVLYQQQNAQWTVGIDGDADIMIFNNGSSRPELGAELISGSVLKQTAPYGMGENYSEIFDIASGWTAHSGYSTDAEIVSTLTLDKALYSPLAARAQRLPNGNTLLTQTHRNTVYELTGEGEVVWQHHYQEPGQISSVQKLSSSHAGLQLVLARLNEQ